MLTLFIKTNVKFKYDLQDLYFKPCALLAKIVIIIMIKFNFILMQWQSEIDLHKNNDFTITIRQTHCVINYKLILFCIGKIYNKMRERQN